jgi:hypothetical protein
MIVEKYNDTSKDLSFAILEALGGDETMIEEKYRSTEDDLLFAIYNQIVLNGGGGGGGGSTSFGDIVRIYDSYTLTEADNKKIIVYDPLNDPSPPEYAVPGPNVQTITVPNSLPDNFSCYVIPLSFINNESPLQFAATNPVNDDAVVTLVNVNNVFETLKEFQSVLVQSTGTPSDEFTAHIGRKVSLSFLEVLAGGGGASAPIDISQPDLLAMSDKGNAIYKINTSTTSATRTNPLYVQSIDGKLIKEAEIEKPANTIKFDFNSVKTYLRIDDFNFTFQVGDTITQASTGATGVLSYISNSYIFLTDVTGVFTNDSTITNGSYSTDQFSVIGTYTNITLDDIGRSISNLSGGVATITNVVGNKMTANIVSGTWEAASILFFTSNPSQRIGVNTSSIMRDMGLFQVQYDLDNDVVDNYNYLTKDIPLSGTLSGKPITGNLEFQNTIGEEQYFHIKRGNASLHFDDNEISLNKAFSTFSLRESGHFLIKSYEGYNTSYYVSLEANSATGLMFSSSALSGNFSANIDFSANNTDLSFVQKIYVDKISGIKGTATLVAGTATVADVNIKTGAKIYVSVNTPGGTQGFLSAATADIIDTTSFVINSSSATDTSIVNYWFVNQ